MSAVMDFIKAVLHPSQVERPRPPDLLAFEESRSRMAASTRRLNRAVSEKDNFGAMIDRMKGKPSKRNGK